MTGEHFRPGTHCEIYPVVFLLNNSGLGDFICFTSALQWIAENCPWIQGSVYVSEFLVPFLRLAFAEWPHWKVGPGEKIELDTSVCVIGPDITINGHVYFQQLLNATGAHLVDLGFAYYANMNPAPADAIYPQLNFPEAKLPKALRGKEGQYVCFTPGAPTTSRTVRGHHLNPLIAYVIELGLIPVFLGRSQISSTHKANFADDIHYHKGLDLRDQTTVLDAACIMQYACCTLGLDNGLLHLAACTPGNVIFGYNIASPEHREPRRGQYQDRTINITVPHSRLPCIHCQSNMKMVIQHSFHKCFYGDLRCIDLLFSEGEEQWKKAIRDFLRETVSSPTSSGFSGKLEAGPKASPPSLPE
jgi:ADP-heptose:LPS heptosyltransferase